MEDAVNDACLRWHRADEFWEAVKWAISHDPSIGTPMEGGVLRVVDWNGARSANLPSAWVAYSVEPHTVVMLDVRFFDSPFTAYGRA